MKNNPINQKLIVAYYLTGGSMEMDCLFQDRILNAYAAKYGLPEADSEFTYCSFPLGEDESANDNYQQLLSDIRLHTNAEKTQFLLMVYSKHSIATSRHFANIFEKGVKNAGAQMVYVKQGEPPPFLQYELF